MKTFRCLLSLMAVLVAVSCAPLPKTPNGPAPLLILVSIDGFRADYLDRGVTPNLSALAASGARGPMRPSFPSLTYPNHYSLVTGLRPDHNGVVNNTMRDDRQPGVIFKMSNNGAVQDDFWWAQAKPVWTSVEEHGARAATLFWPGSEAENHGRRPSYWLHYDEAMTSEARVAQVLSWVDMPADQRPGFITLYYSMVDHAGHDFGPDSPEVDAALAEADASIGQLLDGLRQRGLEGKVNLIIVADHGMAPHRPERFIRLEDMLPAGSYDVHAAGSVANIAAMPSHAAEVERVLIKTPHRYMHCWHKARLPVRFHYGHNPRIPEYVCLADVGGYIIGPSQDGWTPKPHGGSHGYDPDLNEMSALFIASGPDIRPGVVLPRFDNVDVYDLEMRLLHLPPEPNDGRLAPLRPALK